MIEVRQTEEFANWLELLRDAKAAAKIAQRIVRVSFGPGYRIYFVQRGKALFILLCGGDKSTQARDIKRAKELAADL